MTARIFSLLLAFVSWACSAWLALAAYVWGVVLKCDDSCSDVGGWREDPDAWQWNAFAAAGLVAFLAGTGLLVFVWLRRPLWGAGCVVVGLGAALWLTNTFSSDWFDHLDRHSPGELLLYSTGVFAPIFAVLLTLAPSGASASER
jgi:hypothetical protein